MILTLAIIKGGATKTTTAVHLACALADRGRKVLVLDTDRQASAWRWVTTAAAAGEPLPVSVEHMASEHFVQRLDEFARQYDDIVIDVGPGDSGIMIEAMRVADLVVIPLNARPDDQEQAIKAAQQCRSESIPHVAMLTRVRRSETSSIRGAVEELVAAQVPMTTLVVPELTEIGHSFGSRAMSHVGFYDDLLTDLMRIAEVGQEVGS